MPAQAVQCPGCHATTSSYPDPHGVRICNYCGTLFKLGSEGPTLIDASSGVPKAKSSPGAWIGIGAAVLVITIAVSVFVASRDEGSSSSDSSAAGSSPTIDLSDITKPSPGSSKMGSGVSVAAVPPPPPPKPPEAEFTFHNTRSSSGTTFYVLGEIANTGEVPLDHPKLTIVLKDDAGKEVGTDFGFSERDIIYPGESSPVSAIVSDPPPHASLEYELILREATYFPEMVEGLELRDPAVSKAKYGSGFQAKGQVEHTGDKAAKFVKIEAHALDAEGKLLGLYTTYADGDRLEPGKTARFSFLGMYFDEEPANYEFYVSGRVAD